MALKFGRVFRSAASEHGRGWQTARHFRREVRTGQDTNRMRGKNFPENLAHSHPAPVFDSFCATKKKGVPIQHDVAETTRDWSQRRRWNDEDNEVGVGAIIETIR